MAERGSRIELALAARSKPERRAPTLADRHDLSIDELVPQIDGGPLALFDEYRCLPCAPT
jgi:hypothetical protein